MKRYLLLLLFIAALQCGAFAQDIHFTTVEPPKEQPWKSIFGMAQDASGYLWIATNYGLYKYNGKESTFYQHDVNNPNSLAIDYVGSVFGDKQGIVWLGTWAGLDRFDPVTNTFKHYRHQANDPGSLACDSIECILGDRDGTLWLGTFKGLDKFDPQTGRFKHFVHNAKNPGSISNDHVRILYEDRAGTIWVGTGTPFINETPSSDGGLNKLDKKTGTFTRYMHDANDQHTLIDNRVRAIFEDSRGVFWVGTAGDGLHTMDRKTGKFERHLFDPAHPEKLSRPALKNTKTYAYADDHITFINEDNSGRIWIGTYENGINVYDPKTQKTVWYGNGPGSKEKLSQISFWYAYKTREGVLWVAPWLSTDLYKINPYQNKPQYTHLGKKYVNAFVEDTAGTLWLATIKGLIRQGAGIQPETFYAGKKVDSLKSRFFDIEKDRDNTFWLAGISGLYRFDPATRIFTGYHHQNGIASSLICDTVMYVKKGTAGKLLVGTSRGLDLMDTKTGTFRHFRKNKNDSTSISDNFIFSIETDNNNNVWVGTNDGLDKLDEKTGRFKRYLSGVTVICVLNDSRGNLWAGTMSGFFRYDKTRDLFTAVDVDANSVWGIAEDQHKNLWLNTNRGIIKLNTQNNEWNVYGINEGVNANVTSNFGYRRYNGEILFGDTAGYFTFQPDKLLHSSPPSMVVINGFLLNDVPVVPQQGGILTGPVINTTEIRLNHNQSTFAFSFGIIDFVSAAGENRVFFMLENYDSKWRKATADGAANFYNIQPGQYIFKVKSVNANGLVTEKHIAVIISPPWWQTWWAYTIFALAFAGSIWGFIWYRSRALIREKRILEETVQIRTAEVMEQKEELEQQKEELEVQAREAQIEAALERVRSRSMAMQKSEELQEVIKVVYEQLVHLRILVEHAGFIMDYNTRDDMHIWLADKHYAPAEITIPYFDSPHWNSFNEAKEKGLNFFANYLTFEEKNRFYQDLFKLIAGVTDETKEYYLSCPGLAISTVLLETVGLYIENFSGIPYSDEENATLMRFGKVFQQTYTRFNDLQRAEAQAREAKIEAALERVRSRTMAMQHSDELLDAALLLFQQTETLGVKAFGCGFNIWDDDRQFATTWMGTIAGLGQPIKTDCSKDIYLPIYEAAQKGESLFVREQGGEDLKLHHQYLNTIPVFRDWYMASSSQAGFSLPTYQIMNCAFFAQGYLSFISYEPCPDAYDIFKRFAKVFEQTYTRFLDLQRAEAQTREAVKQASIDRVRGEIASMRTTKDLERIIPLIWNELTILAIPFIRCGVFIVDEQAELIHYHLSTPDGKALAAFDLPFDTAGIGRVALPAWRKKQIATVHWSPEEFAANTKTLVSQGAVKSRGKYVKERPNTTLDLHFFPFLQGMLYAGNTAPLSDDEKDLVQSLADAFSTAYARYEDFNKLEAAKQQVDITLTELKAAQTQLIQSAKMASLGELTAGIAHEIQNPLNFVNNFSEVNREMIDELKSELKGGNVNEAIAIADNIGQNEEKIIHHGKRADAIVKGMLQHSQSRSGSKELTNINAVADEYLRLAYHGLRAKDKSFNAEMITHFDPDLPKIKVIGQDIGRVLLNLFNNAFYAVNQKQKTASSDLKPEVSVTTFTENGQIIIKVKDNGIGIPDAIKEKIMQPFFTTKPTGEGTGLGLSLTYDMVVKGHGGKIEVTTKEGDFTEVIVTLPI